MFVWPREVIAIIRGVQISEIEISHCNLEIAGPGSKQLFHVQNGLLRLFWTFAELKILHFKLERLSEL